LSLLPSGPEPVWLPGNVEVQVSGETFHAEAIREADRHRPPGVTDVAVLVLEPNNPHDHSAIAVFVNGFLAGHLSREIAGAVQPSLIAFAAANCGRTVACPARIIWHQIDNQPVAQVILRLDPAPLGLTPDDFKPVPEIDRVIQQHLQRLDITAPVMTGCDTAARSLLAAAEAQRSQADAEDWPQVERAFLQAIRQMEQACDPLIADAWAGLARSVRYQKGRRDDRITAVGFGVAADEIRHRNLPRVRVSFASLACSIALVKSSQRVPDQRPRRLTLHGDREQMLPGSDVGADLVRVG